MSISFTSSIISRLKRDIAEIERQIVQDKSKIAKINAKIKQLQTDKPEGSSPADQSKMTQIKKLSAQAVQLAESQTGLAKQLSVKNAELRLQLAKEKGI
ncbi:hypothetical protein EV294_11630 [Paenibacillus sp. BK033]|uniref:hypothetical protein n=2 Tax=unclassified Paenibacillus TaxID=185978 RepID=UPI00104A26EC|nr:hypothetical protein [Paenibacillus sp. BK033]NIK72411.1 gentisate 1,2-dioxygenase [Paenibacillus sp. BK720]TCM87948.1 hypothetical protein EV294_11630 [Paenibacillus sp. BK033]